MQMLIIKNNENHIETCHVNANTISLLDFSKIELLTGHWLIISPFQKLRSNKRQARKLEGYGGGI